MTDSRGFRIADAQRLGRLLDRLSRRIHGELGPSVRLVGILRRGAPLARELGRRLSDLRGDEVTVGTLRLERYADDLTLLHDVPMLEEDEPLPFQIEDAQVLLVDDVIYSGRTLLEAVRYVTAAGARTVHVAALCSRGPNEVPVHADFVGMAIDVGEGNVIEVHAPPYEDEWAVHLFHQSDLAADNRP